MNDEEKWLVGLYSIVTNHRAHHPLMPELLEELDEAAKRVAFKLHEIRNKE